MSFTKINAAGIGSTETVTINGLSVIGDGSFGGNVSVAGTLTYEDVTNIDSVGLITARNGIVVGSGITLSPDGHGFYTGVITATSFVGDISNATGINTANVRTGILDVAGIATFRSNTLVGSGITLSPDGDGFFSGITTITSGTFGGGVLQENWDNHGALTGTHNHDAHTHGMILRSGTAATGTFIINLRGDASTTFGSLFIYPKATTMTIYSASNNASYYMTAFQIDGSAQTVKWSGGSAPSAGTGSGVDVYSMTILALGSNTYEVYGNFSNFA